MITSIYGRELFINAYDLDRLMITSRISVLDMNKSLPLCWLKPAKQEKNIDHYM